MDRVRGPHRGKGPKDYKRSEDRIKEDVCDRLSDDDMVDASHIQIQVQGQEVVLTGSVSSREEKRRAEDVVESISGVRNVENRLRVGRTDDYTSKNYTGTTNEITDIGDESGTTNEIIRNQRNK
jgi:Flp pilus assembly secretin CpaC